MNLEDYRKQIDSIDDDILKLFLKRMNIAGDIAKFKKEQHLGISHPTREREIIIRLARAAGPEFASYVQMLYGTLFDVSRAHQHQLNSEPGQLSADLKTAWENSSQNTLPQLATVACQGTEGAYSGLAAGRCFQLPDITWFRNFEGVAQAVKKGLCDYGILPVENSTYGTVNPVYDLMQQHRFYIVKSIRLHVQHSLLALPGVKMNEIREIVSHQQAIGQCDHFLSALPNVKVTPVANTAIAANLVATSNRRDLAAISSHDCGRLYNLDTLQEGIQDNGNNYTRFICITKDLTILPGASRISLVMSLPHRPGSLYSVIAKFAALGLNLLKLESRPVSGSDFEFRFYFDLAATECSPAVLNLMNELEHELDDFTFLGWYNEA
ncbi:MAG: chorismate mutase [Lentisphaeria bacterium]|nr:chorismate mutase [Lentisphaeria bacterium]